MESARSIPTYDVSYNLAEQHNRPSIGDERVVQKDVIYLLLIPLFRVYSGYDALFEIRDIWRLEYANDNAFRWCDFRGTDSRASLSKTGFNKIAIQETP